MSFTYTPLSASAGVVELAQATGAATGQDSQGTQVQPSTPAGDPASTQVQEQNGAAPGTTGTDPATTTPAASEGATTTPLSGAPGDAGTNAGTAPNATTAEGGVAPGGVDAGAVAPDAAVGAAPGVVPGAGDALSQSPLPKSLPESVFEQIMALMDMGGPVVVLLAILSVMSLTVILYKLWQFSYMGIGRHKRARKALGYWRAGRQAEAIALLEKGRAPVSKVLVHAMRGQLYHREKGSLIREDVERVALFSLSRTRFLVRFLETVGQISPLLGLFGTVIGMIEAFQKLQQAGATVDPSVLAGGIWVALLTTAVGLAVAIPASLFADWFTSRVENEQEVIEELVTSVLTGQITDRSAIPASPEAPGEVAYAT